MYPSITLSQAIEAAAPASQDVALPTLKDEVWKDMIALSTPIATATCSPSCMLAIL